MAAEYEELKLTINLTDHASAKIASMRADLANVGQGSQLAEWQRTGGHFNATGLALRAASQATNTSIASLATLGQALRYGPGLMAGIIVGGLGAMNKAAEEFTASLEEIWKVSEITGSSVAQLNEWMKAAERAGGDKSAVARMALDTRNAAADILRERSNLVNQMKREGRFDPLGTQQMIDKLRTLAQTDFPAFQMELMARVQNVTENARKEGKNEALVQRDRERAMRMFGIDPKMQRLFEQGKLKLVTKEEVKNWEERVKNMRLFHEHSRKIADSIRELKEKFLSVALNKDLPLIRTLKWVFETVTKLAGLTVQGLGIVRKYFDTFSKGSPDEQYEKWKRENPDSEFLKPPSTPYRFTDAEQTDIIGDVTFQFKLFNDWLAIPEHQKFFFHNAPQGGARGESNPKQIPPNAPQPGGGAAAEARPNKNFTGTAPSGYGPYKPVSKEEAGGAQASVRYNNPGAAFPRSTGEHMLYGSTGYGVLKDREGKYIAAFNDPTLGAAYNFWLYQERFAGKPISSAMDVWSGGDRSGTSGYNPKTVVTKDMLNDPDFAVPYMMSLAGDEAKKLGITKEQMKQAHDVYRAGGVDKYAVPKIDEMVGKPEDIPLDPELTGAGGAGSADDTQIKSNKSQRQRAQDALKDVHSYLADQASGGDLKRMQRAVEGVTPGSDEEWELRRQQALKTGSAQNRSGPGGYSESENALVPFAYGPGSGLPYMGEIEDTIRSHGRRYKQTDENVQKTEEYYSQPDWKDLHRGRDSPNFDMWGRPIPYEELDPSKQKINLDRSDLSRTDPNRIELDGSLDVDVEAPRGTTVDAQGDGVFTNTNVNRTMPTEVEI